MKAWLGCLVLLVCAVVLWRMGAQCVPCPIKNGMCFGDTNWCPPVLKKGSAAQERVSAMSQEKVSSLKFTAADFKPRSIRMVDGGGPACGFIIVDDAVELANARLKQMLEGAPRLQGRRVNKRFLWCEDENELRDCTHQALAVCIEPLEGRDG